MPPALGKNLEKDHRVHISSPVLNPDLDLIRVMDPQLKPVDHSYTRFWHNLSSLSALDFCSIKSLLELTEMPLQSLFNNSVPYKIDLQPSLGALLGSVSMDKSHADCLLFNEQSGLEEQKASIEETKNFLKGHRNLEKTPLPPLQHFQTESKLRSSETLKGNKNRNQSNVLRQEWHPACPDAAQEKVDAQRQQLASKLHTLVTRTNKAKLRLHAVLGENALQSISKQLKEIKEKLSPTSTKTEPDTLLMNSPAVNKCANSKQPSSIRSGPEVQQGSSTLRSSLEDSLLGKTSESVQFIRSVRNLVQCGQAVLCKAHQDLDSDATESSSDDEWKDEPKEKTPISGCLGCDWRYQCERAKLASQWTWIKLRLSELDSQIQQMSQLHQRLLANKEGVVLAETQPLTDLQIQQTLLTETAGLTLTAAQTHDLNSELDTEPSSPTRLLKNIERQSAQLSQMVNSLMSPLSDSPSHSPVAKEDISCWKGSRKRSFNSSACMGMTVQRKRCLGHRSQRQSQVKVTRACARTRPLLTYHKPRLFIVDQSSVTQQEADSSAYWYTNRTNKGNTINSMLNTSFIEDWLHRSPSIIFSPSFSTAEKHTSSIFNCTHELQSSQFHSISTQTQATPTVKRRRQRGTDICDSSKCSPNFSVYCGSPDTCVSQSGTFSPSAEKRTDDVLTPHHTSLHQKKSQFPSCRRKGESIHNINNIVVPAPLAATATVEKLQYKDILTPSWRIVKLSPINKKEEKRISKQVESLSDEVFLQRHKRYERREKLCWSSWEKGRRYTHRTRFSSSTDVSAEFEPNPWTCNTPTDAAQVSMEKREPQPPWERRVFPLHETDEEALRRQAPIICSKDEDMDSSLSDSSCKNNAFPVCDHTLPPAGQTRNNKPTVSSIDSMRHLLMTTLQEYRDSEQYVTSC